MNKVMYVDPEKFEALARDLFNQQAIPSTYSWPQAVKSAIKERSLFRMPLNIVYTNKWGTVTIYPKKSSSGAV